MRTEANARAARSRKAAGLPSACATVRVAEPPHLCRVQSTTRDFCRSVGLDESAVFQAVISVTELAHRLFIERAQCGSIELHAVRRRGGLALDVLAENDAFPRLPSVRVRLTFTPARGTMYS
jgi:hypothetical protein